uniref:2OGFeDO JBP1/TET oxygenase domain-containing protein n=1 Tax=viral metagenome TaxID=1070528 RepID=A0A6C0BSA1_9ZZZZ
MVKKIVVNKILTDEESSGLEGKWIDESYIKHPLIQSDTDVYRIDEDDNEILLLKFRKRVISDKLIQIGWESYKDLAKASRGRGASAGPINPESQYWKKRDLVKTSKWSTGYLTPKGNEMKKEYDELSLELLQEKAKEMKIDEETINDKNKLILEIIKNNGGVSKMKVNNQVASNPIGYYEESKNFAKLPCRLTHFTRTNYDKYNNGLKFIQRIDKLFERLIPDAHSKQLERANKRPHLKIPKTSFSTITINRNFRTALHKDAGDFRDGFGNLTVIERGKYHGGYTVFPQYGIGINLRNNDFCAMDVHQWHSNTPIYETEEDKKYNDTLEPDYNDNPEVGTEGLYKKYTRLSFVCYLREKIVNCPEYKDLTELDLSHLTKSGHNKIVIEE